MPAAVAAPSPGPPEPLCPLCNRATGRHVGHRHRILECSACGLEWEEFVPDGPQDRLYASPGRRRG